VIVSWQSGTELVACVESLAAARRLAAFEVELVIVDNASTEFPAATVASAWPDARLIRNETNRGFGPAANQGATVAGGDVLLLLNPDTRAVGDPFAPLVEAFEVQREAVAIAPRLLETGPGQGMPQSRFQLRRLPTLGQAAHELLLLDRIFPNGRRARREFYLDRDRDLPFRVEQPAAAALAVRRDVFRRLGGFDEAFVPAWFEDVDLCARLLDEGTILYWPTSRFDHLGGGAARSLGYDWFLPFYYRNACRYWRKHHGRAGSATYRTLLCVGMVLRLIALPLAPASPASATRAFARAILVALGIGIGPALARPR
jgi:GT2 family glycosyltransferase